MDERHIANFWSKVDKRSVEVCWPWLAGKRHFGHGSCNRHHFGTQQAHRAAYAITNGPIKPGLVVRHTCDNPPCCNPAHLVLGTHADNVADCISRGRARTASGHESGQAKLSPTQVADIRASSLSNRAAAEKHGVTASVVSEVRNFRTYASGEDRNATPRTDRGRRRDLGF